MTGPVVFIQGEMVAASAARITIDDRGLTLGDGVFETLAIHDRRLPFLDAHLARLTESAAVLGLPAPDTATLGRAARALVSRNCLDAGTLRITLTRGCGPRGLAPPEPASPTVLITTAPAAAQPPGPARAQVATITRRNQASPLSRIKALGGYLDSILALREARACGADDALLLNTSDRLACATSANLFAVIDGVLVTPPLAEGVLAGVVRSQVLTLARTAAGTPRLLHLLRAVAEQPLTVADLETATEAFLTNVAIAVRPLIGLNGRAIATGQPGPLTGWLAQSYRDHCRQTAAITPEL